MKPLRLQPHIRSVLARIEPTIALSPVEHLYVIDSEGRVVGHRIGSKRKVVAGKRLTKWMASHPLGFVTTHNHPRETSHSRRDVENALRRSTRRPGACGRPTGSTTSCGCTRGASGG